MSYAVPDSSYFIFFLVTVDDLVPSYVWCLTVQVSWYQLAPINLRHSWFSTVCVNRQFKTNGDFYISIFLHSDHSESKVSWCNENFSCVKMWKSFFLQSKVTEAISLTMVGFNSIINYWHIDRIFVLFIISLTLHMAGHHLVLFIIWRHVWEYNNAMD